MAGNSFSGKAIKGSDCFWMEFEVHRKNEKTLNRDKILINHLKRQFGGKQNWETQTRREKRSERECKRRENLPEIRGWCCMTQLWSLFLIRVFCFIYCRRIIIKLFYRHDRHADLCSSESSKVCLIFELSIKIILLMVKNEREQKKSLN